MTAPTNQAYRPRPANKPDSRSKAEKRAGRKKYGKAHAYYGKTYIVTQKQVWAGLVLWLGSVLAFAGGLFWVYIKVYQAVG